MSGFLLFPYGTSDDARFTCTVCKYVDAAKKTEAEDFAREHGIKFGIVEEQRVADHETDLQSYYHYDDARVHILFIRG